MYFTESVHSNLKNSQEEKNEQQNHFVKLLEKFKCCYFGHNLEQEIPVITLSIKSTVGSKKYPVRLERRAESFASLETRPDSPGEFGMQPRDSCRPWSGTLCPRHKPR